MNFGFFKVIYRRIKIFVVMSCLVHGHFRASVGLGKRIAVSRYSWLCHAMPWAFQSESWARKRIEFGPECKISTTLFNVPCLDMRSGPYLPIILHTILSLVLQIFLYLTVFECNTTFDWLNRMV